MRFRLASRSMTLDDLELLSSNVLGILLSRLTFALARLSCWLP